MDEYTFSDIMANFFPLGGKKKICFSKFSIVLLVLLLTTLKNLNILMQHTVNMCLVCCICMHVQVTYMCVCKIVYFLSLFNSF